jgi:UDPglucose 6-dehydrogenase
LSFKADTDDTRESPALALAAELVAQGAQVRTYDPVVKSGVTGATNARTALSAARGTHAVIVATEWAEFRQVDLRTVRAVMTGDILVDGRGIYEPKAVEAAGLEYIGFRRRAVAVSPPRELRP